LIVTSLLCTEGALRVVGWFQSKALQGRPQGWETIWAFSPELHHRLLPNGMIHHRTFEYNYLWTNNSFGMRDRERSLTKDSNTFRILFLGDSMVQGQGVPAEQTLTARLETTLNRPPRSKRLEVWNAGVFGYSPMLEDLYLHQMMGSTSPDMVLEAVTLENDVGEDYFYSHIAHCSTSSEFKCFDDQLWPWSKIVEALGSKKAPETDSKTAGAGAGSLLFLREHVLNHSRIFEVLKGWESEHRGNLNYAARRESEFALVRERKTEIGYDLGLINYPLLTREQRLEYWKVSEKYLSDMTMVCRARGIPFVLVVIPPYQRLTGETTFDEPYQILEDFGREYSVPVIQLLPDFLKRKPEELYYKYDRHWTRDGNQLAAAVVGRELRRLSLLPAEAKP
jgi:hypothetical protein